MRAVCCLSLVLAAGCAEAAQAAAPPARASLRYLSLTEAVVLALEQGTDRKGTVRVITRTDPATRRCTAPLFVDLRTSCPRLEADRFINQKLLNVEVAYWNLYAARWTLHTREVGLRSAYETFQLSKTRYEGGRATTADIAEARGQYELFRAQRLQALDMVLENERHLRAFLGLPAKDGTRLVPCDTPRRTHTELDWSASLKEALANRPELEMSRQEVLQAEQVLSLARTLGDALVGLPGLCPPPSEVEGTRPGADGRCVIGSHRVYQPQSTSLQVRRAQLQLARALETLNDQERKTERFLGLQYRRISTAREQVRANRAQREAFAEQLRARQQEYLAGRGTLDVLLEAQRFCADCQSNEHQALATYNNALAGFEFARGTIQQHDNVVILPDSPGP